VPFQERMLTGYGEVSRRVILGREPWKAAVREEITDCNGTKFYELLDDRQRRYVLERIAGVDISDLGVAPSIMQETRRESLSQRP